MEQWNVQGKDSGVFSPLVFIGESKHFADTKIENILIYKKDPIVPKENMITSNIRLNFGTKTLSYEPYRGETFAIPLGQTVYGGTLDVTTGVLTVTHIEHVEDGSRNFGLSFLPVLIFDFFPEEMKGIFGSRIISNMFGAPNNLVWGSGSARQISLNVTGTPLAELSTKEEFKSYFKGLYDAGNPATFVYELANPVTIQLTPTEIYALSSVNTIYADTGNVTVSGYSDPKDIINTLADRIAALEQNAIGG